MKIYSNPRDPALVYSSPFEAGDYLPNFVIMEGERKFDAQLKAGAELLLIFIAEELSDAALAICLATATGRSTVYISPVTRTRKHASLFTSDPVYQRFMGESHAAFGLFLADSNLKLLHCSKGDDLALLLSALPATDNAVGRGSLPPPLLIVPDVVSPALAQELMGYFDANSEHAFSNTGAYKSRQHVHPSLPLEMALDDKLCKSLLPEIRKVFFSEISHRETYKICCYDGEARGTFGKHRDTIDPHLHRRYAMTLLLNNDYEGGGIAFPEYNAQVLNAPVYSAIIFPGSLYHEVKPIEKGRRFVIVSFFFTQAEARLKSDTERYRFRVQRNDCDLLLHQLWPDSDPAP